MFWTNPGYLLLLGRKCRPQVPVKLRFLSTKRVVSYTRRLCCELISAACNVLVSLLLYTFMLNTLK